jgi:glutaredoxin
MMRPSLRLLQQAARITFFSSPNCSLCDKAKAVVSRVKTRRDFEYQEINVRAAGQEQWMNKYAFDTPVVC